MWSADLLLDPERLWTYADLDELPDDLDWKRFEIVDGVLVVRPSATPLHQRFVMRLGIVLADALPAGFDVIGSVMIDLDPSYRIPDVTVISNQVYQQEGGPVAPADILLAVEIESPSSITTDRITKPAQYAAGGIPHYWRLEASPLRLHTHRLADGVYERVGNWDVGQLARITEPFPVEIDLVTLLPD